jgi:hypothetical protein
MEIIQKYLFTTYKQILNGKLVPRGVVHYNIAIC